MDTKKYGCKEGSLIIIAEPTLVYSDKMRKRKLIGVVENGQVGIVLACKRRCLSKVIIACAAFASGLVGWCELDVQSELR